MAVPYLGEFELRYYDDLETLLVDWDAGVLDAASGLQPDDAVALGQRSGARLVTYPGTTLLAVALNLRAEQREFQQ